MQRHIIKLFFAVVCLSVTQSTHAQDPNFYLFLCFGQSNMEGQGTIESVDRTVNERFQVYQALDCSNLSREKGNWYPAIPPLTRCWTRLSPADYFGRTMVENLPEQVRVGVINVSVGGCRIELFDKDIYENYTNTYTEEWFQNAINDYGRNPYQYLIDLAKEAQKDGIIKGILLHQGESNNSDNQWPDKVKKIYEDMVTDLQLDPTKTPLLAGEMVHEDQDGLLAGMNTIINQLPDVLDNSYVISSSGCSDQDDNIHFNSAGYRELGKRYAEKMLEVIDKTVVPLEAAQPSHDGLHLEAVYPNPTSGPLQISFSTPSTEIVNIYLQDLVGRSVMQLTNKSYSAGSYSLAYNADDLPKGAYFIIIESAGHTHSSRILVR
ncbi:sialate O-acetylesterase [Marinoscillum sp.]|uniref:T9SS type A sorting domain-containing protein n=1 Tax=Marinoscillum sp. TaxID=2024838 RepID=UPI003BAAD191